MRIITREEWGARPPRSRVTVPWSRRTGFVVHYSAASPDQTPRQIQNYHMDARGWADIGYNFLVDDEGRIYEGRGWTTLGAHASGHNEETIGVCWIGRDRAGVKDTPAVALAAIRWLYDEACRRAGRALRKLGHRDVGATACPGDELYAWVRAGMPAPGGAPTAPKPPAPKPSAPAGVNWTEVIVNTLPTLRRGATGAAVKRLQALLNVAGAQLREDGDFGPKTDSALRSFQARHKVRNSVVNGHGDGIAGRYTWAALLGV